MEIKKAQFKVKNGTVWDKYHFETSADQVKMLNEDGTESDMQSGIEAALRIKPISQNGNLSTECLESGIYFYKANTAGNPGGLLPGVMITLGAADSGKVYKIIINTLGIMYRMVNNSDGTVVAEWKQL